MPVAVFDERRSTKTAGVRIAGKALAEVRTSENFSLSETIVPDLSRLQLAVEPWRNREDRGTTQQKLDRRNIEAPVRIRPTKIRPRRFTALQQWEGVVTSIDSGDGEIEAEIRDLTCPTNPPEFIRFDSDEIPAEDKRLLAAGSVFYWVIGYETKSNGQIARISEMRLKRARKWSQREVETMQKSGLELFQKLADQIDEQAPAQCK